jgi:hypothetical protein
MVPSLETKRHFGAAATPARLFGREFSWRTPEITKCRQSATQYPQVLPSRMIQKMPLDSATFMAPACATGGANVTIFGPAI